ncbi:MAG: hypothetical protein AAF702_07930 [Chloroflexota bacterium]
MRIKDYACPSILLLILGICLTRMGYLATTLHQYQMDMDEAIHAIHGLDVAIALKQGSFSLLWEQIVKPHWYPPAHGLMLGFWDLIFGAGVSSARLYSTFWLLISLVLIWQSTKVLYPKSLYPSRLTPTLSSCILLLPSMFLVADLLHILYGAMSMLEMVILALTLATLLAFVRAEQQVDLRKDDVGQPKVNRASSWYYLLAGILAMLCFFVKYSSGILILGTLFLSVLISMGERQWRQGIDASTFEAEAEENEHRNRHNPNVLIHYVIALVPAALFGLITLIGWLFGLQQLEWLLVYAGAQPEKFQMWEMANLLYYPIQLVSDPVNGIALLLALLSLPIHLRHYERRRLIMPCLIFFGLGLMMLTATLQNNLRFGMILFPPIWLLAPGIVMSGILGEHREGRSDRSREKQTTAPVDSIMSVRNIVVASILLVPLIGVVRTQVQLPQRLIQEYENVGTDVHAAYDFIATTLDLYAFSQPTLNLSTEFASSIPQITLIGRQDQWNGRALRFYLESRCLEQGFFCPMDLVDDKDIREGWPRREFSDEEKAKRYADRFESSEYLILIGKPLERPELWQTLGRAPYTFLRDGKEPAPVEVVVVQRKAATP